MTQWTFRIAAVCLWAATLALARVALASPSVFRVVLSLALALWGLAIWRRHRHAVRLLVAALVAIGAFAPLGWINPFHVVDAKDAVVAAPGFVWRTIASALVISATALTGAILLAYASRGRRAQTSGTKVRPDALHSWRTVAILLGVGWVILVGMSTTAFLDAVRLTRRAQALRQQARDIPSERPNPPLPPTVAPP